MDDDSKARMATRLRRTRIIELASQGRKTQEIQEELGVSRETVSRALNTLDSKTVIKEAQERFRGLLSKAMEVYETSLANTDRDMTNAQRAARDILKSHGVVKDAVDINHSFPKPTVIKRADGTEVVLGTAEEDDDG